MNSEEVILYVKVSNTVDPFGRRLVEKISQTSSGQKFIKQYYLNQDELAGFIEKCRMTGIRIESNNSLGDDTFMTSSFSAARPYDISTRQNHMLSMDPSAAYRSATTVRANPPPRNVQPNPVNDVMPMGMTGGRNEHFVDFNGDGFGSCMFGGGLNANGKFSSR